MRLKRVLSVLFAIALVLSALPALAESDATFEFSIVNAGVTSDGTVKVNLNAASSDATEALGCDIMFDTDVLTYIGFENTYGFDENDILSPYFNAKTGKVIFRAISVQPPYNGTLITLFFKCNEDVLDGTDSVTTEITPVYQENSCFDRELEEIPEENQIFNSDTVTFQKKHTASSFEAAIEGEAVAGSELRAVVIGFSDPLGLEPVFSYKWTVDGSTVSTTEAYTVKPSDAGKRITLAVTSTVEAEDKPKTTVSVMSDTVEKDETKEHETVTPHTSYDYSTSDDDGDNEPAAQPAEIKITSQPSETVEYKEGEDIKLEVKAANAKKYKWEWCELTSETPQKVYKTTEIAGANASVYVIEKADKSFDGKMIRCTAMSDNSEVKTNVITLKMADKKEDVNKVNIGEASDWALSELQKANAAGLIPGIFEGQNMTQNITRREFAHVAVKLYEKISGKEAVPVSENPFEDTDDTEVLKAYNVGITLGTSETTFTPDSLITREQMATMLTRALREAGIDTSADISTAEKFSDDDAMNDWGRGAIYFMSQNGIILGMGDGTFAPLGNATCEHALLISVRSAEKFSK